MLPGKEKSGMEESVKNIVILGRMLWKLPSDSFLLGIGIRLALITAIFVIHKNNSFEQIWSKETKSWM